MLGTRLETVSRKGEIQMTTKREAFQYISIKKTLHALLNKESVREKLKLFKNQLDFQPLHYSHSIFGAIQKH